MMQPSDDGADRVEQVEHRWAAVSVAIVVLLVVMATLAGLHLVRRSRSAQPAPMWCTAS
jgi:hypothetical protein